MNEIKYLNIGMIDPSDFNGRLEIDEDADLELTESIKSIGILEPLIVRKKEKRIELIAGSRRYRCAKIAGLGSVPCIFITADDSLAEKIKLHENLKRLDLSHVDQGYTFARLKTEFNLTENEISELVGKSVPYVSQHISLISAGNDIIEAVQNENINFSVARELIQVKNEEDRTHLLNYAVKGGASVSTVREWVNTANNERQNKPAGVPLTVTESNYASKSLPTFTCQACEHNHVIKEMVVRRLCPECDFLIFDEIRKQKEMVTSTSANGTSETG